MSSFVTIKKPYNHKSHRIKGIGSNVCSLRLSDYEMKLLRKCCNKLDIKPCTLIKYCVVEFCKKLNKEEE